MENYIEQSFLNSFLLQNFSLRESPEFINVYNRELDLAERKEISNTNQSFEGYLSKDHLNWKRYTSLVENKADAIIQEIIQHNQIKQSNHQLLINFIMLYAFEERKITSKTKLHVTASWKKLTKFYPNFTKGPLENLDIPGIQSNFYNLDYFLDNWTAVSDLSLAILVNKTADGFIVSDSPFLRYNPLMLKRGFHALSDGLKYKGLIIFFPLSTMHYVMLYDPWAYQISNLNNVINIHNLQDVYSLNILQAVSCNKMIFYNDNFEMDKIINWARSGQEHKLGELVHIQVTDPGDKSKMGHLTYYLEHNCDAALSFLKETPAAENCKSSKLIMTPRIR